MKIAEIEARAFRIPLQSAVSSSRFHLTHRELLVATLRVEGGPDGIGWATTPAMGATAALAMIRDYIAPMLIGCDPRAHQALWDSVSDATHYTGIAGIVALAYAPLDVAVWDIRGKAAGLPLFRLLGGERTAVPVYASDINLGLTETALLEQVSSRLAAGYRAFKMKVGKADPEEDLQRCRAVRALIGPDRDLMIDANQNWTPAEAVRRCRMLADVRPLFIEEPSLSDDIAGHRLVREQGGIPVAVGEQLSRRFEFGAYIEQGAVDIVQPCPWKSGGVTEWMAVQRLAAASNIGVSPHGAVELCAHMAAATQDCGAVENIFGVGLHDLGATPEPLAIADGMMTLSETPGHGVPFDLGPLGAHEVARPAAVGG